MAAVRSKNTGPEVRLRKAVWHRGLRFFTPSGWTKLTGQRLVGAPDLIFARVKIAVFVDGCFWHGCPEHYTLPEDNRDFWKAKLDRNRTRDAKVNRDLEAKGWTVLRFWEHDLRKKNVAGVVELIEKAVRSRLNYLNR